MNENFWRNEAVKDLQRYGALEGSIRNLKDKILMLEQSVMGGAINYGSTPVQGGSTTQEDKLNNYIVKKSRYEKKLAENQTDYTVTKRVLDSLTEQDRAILERCYIWYRPDCINWIMNKFYVSKSQAYDMRNERLFRFTQKMYGVTD